MDYTKILSRAWQITWNHKVLWVFGILVALTTNGGGGNNGNSFNSSSDGRRGDLPDFIPPAMQRFIESPAFIITIIAILCALVIVGIILFLLGVAATGALIGGINLAETTGAVTFTQAWGIGTQNFLKILGLKIGVGILNAVAAVISLICCPLLCLYIPASIILPIFLNFAYFGIILDDTPLIDSLRNSFNLIKTNIVNVLILGLILFAISLGIGFVTAIPFLVALIPVFIAFTQSPREPNMALIAATGVAFLCLVPLSIIIGGVLTTWSTAAWQLAYRQFTGNAPVAPQLPVEPTVSPA